MAQPNMICEVEDCECIYEKHPLPHEIPYPPLKWLKPQTQDSVKNKCDYEAERAYDYAVHAWDECAPWIEVVNRRLTLAMYLKNLVHSDPLFN